MFIDFDIGNTGGRDNGDRCSDWSRRHGNGLCTVIRARTHLGFRRFRRGTSREFSASINRRRLSGSPPRIRCFRCASVNSFAGFAASAGRLRALAHTAGVSPVMVAPNRGISPLASNLRKQRLSEFFGRIDHHVMPSIDGYTAPGRIVTQPIKYFAVKPEL